MAGKIIDTKTEKQQRILLTLLFYPNDLNVQLDGNDKNL